MRQKGFREGTRTLVVTLISLFIFIIIFISFIIILLVIISLFMCSKTKGCTSAPPRGTVEITKITWWRCVPRWVHMIRGDIPLPVMMIIYRILATLVIDHELVESTLVHLYPVKPLIIVVPMQMYCSREARTESGSVWWGNSRGRGAA